MDANERDRDKARAAFIASLEAARRDGELNGVHSLDEVLAELDAIIDEHERQASNPVVS